MLCTDGIFPTPQTLLRHKTVTYKRSVRLTGPFNLKHHEIKNLTLNTTGKIVKATQELSLTIQSKHYAPPDELESTTNLQALV